MCSASYWDQNVFCKLLGPKCVLQVIGTKMCSAIQTIKKELMAHAKNEGTDHAV